MASKRSVLLRGTPIYNEYGKATQTISPGYLVAGVSFLSLQSSTHKVQFALAMERDEFGVGIDDKYRGSGTIAAAYASGDVVKVATFAGGMEALVYIPSGQTVNQDTYLTSTGDGTFSATTTVADFMARSLENIGTVTVPTAVRVQVVGA